MDLRKQLFPLCIILSSWTGNALAADVIPPAIIEKADNYIISWLAPEAGAEYFRQNYRYRFGEIVLDDAAGNIREYKLFYEYLPASRLYNPGDKIEFIYVWVPVKPGGTMGGTVAEKKDGRIIEPTVTKEQALTIALQNGFQPPPGDKLKISLGLQNEAGKRPYWLWILSKDASSIDGYDYSYQRVVVDASTGVFEDWGTVWGIWN